jgi:predicted Zn-dependent protease
VNEEWLRDTVDLLAKRKRTEAAALFLGVENENVTRFAGNRITQNTTRHRYRVSVTAVWKRRRGVAETSDLSSRGVLAAFRRAEEAARTAPEDPEFTPLPGAQVYPEIGDLWSPRTAALTPADKARVVKETVDEAAARGLEAAGIYRSGEYRALFANTSGLAGDGHWTEAEFSVTASTGGAAPATGSAAFTDEDALKIDARALAEEAFQTAELARDPRELPPGRYPTVISARAFGEMLPFMIWQMDRRAADEGRSFFTGKLGRRIVSEKISLVSDPADPANPGLPVDFHNDSTARKKQTIIENGVLEKLWTSRYWAEKQKVEVVSPFYHCSMSGGHQDLAGLVRGLERGLLVMRLWYIRYVNPHDLILTGTSRDGLFWVENGALTHAVRHMRFNDSPVRVLESALVMSRPERRDGRMLIPAVLAPDFNWTSATTF